MLTKPVQDWFPAHLLIGSGSQTIGTRVRYLDGLRGVAVSMVVLFHAALLWAIKHPEAKNWLITRYGSMGVELFFLISGFVILMTLEKCKNFGEFMKRRWLRLWPAMLIACAVYFALLPLATIDPQASVLPGLSLIDDRWYSWVLGHPVHSLNGAYWSLYLEMRFYVFFGLFYFLFGERSAIGALVAMGLLYLVLLAVGHGMGQARWWDIRLVAWFASGALFYRWATERSPFLFRLAVAVGALAAWDYYPSFGPRAFGLALVLLFAIAARSSFVERLMSGMILVWLGAISYPLYLIHSPILDAFGPIAGIPISLGVAYLIAKFAEPRVRAIVDRFFRLRPSVGKQDTEGQPPISVS